MPEPGDVEQAALRLAGIAVETPLIRNHELDRRAGGVVLLKPECFQLTGSFKIRGAYNLMSQLGAEAQRTGVVAFSSGNHAQGVAAAGGLLSIPTTIVMPEDAPAAKLENTRALGGEVVTYDRYDGDREAIAREIARKRGAPIVPAYDHPDIIAGQGTVGLEIARQAEALGLPPDQVLLPCGGGGLIAGSAIALRACLPNVRVHPAEPAGFDDTARSLRSGKREQNAKEARSICDALLAATPGELTFSINARLLSAGFVVSDDEVRDAMRFAFRELKLVLEPGGAVALAAVLSGRVQTRGRTTAAVLSGGNVDVAVFAAIQNEPT